MRDPSLATLGYDPVDGQLVHHEVRSILLFLNAQGLVNSLERPNGGSSVPHRFFAVSVLGSPPKGDRLSDHGIGTQQ